MPRFLTVVLAGFVISAGAGVAQDQSAAPESASGSQNVEGSNANLAAAGKPAEVPQKAPIRRFTPAELEQLVAPIALYPDSLLALVLAASAQPAQIAAAANAINAGTPRAQFDSQAWDGSVQALLHYPEVLVWLSENLPWVQDLGAAVASQQREVMAVVQRVRIKANAAGNLVNTVQQTVSTDDGNIVIDSAQPDTVYVPQYDPNEIYNSEPPYPDFAYAGPYLAGPWLGYDVDWGDGYVWQRPWRGGWERRHGEGRRWHHEREAGNLASNQYFVPATPLQPVGAALSLPRFPMPSRLAVGTPGRFIAYPTTVAPRVPGSYPAGVVSGGIVENGRISYGGVRQGRTIASVQSFPNRMTVRPAPIISTPDYHITRPAVSVERAPVHVVERPVVSGGAVVVHGGGTISGAHAGTTGGYSTGFGGHGR